MSNLYQMRQEYAAGSLNEEEMASDPIQEFGEWMNAAINAGLSEPNAMTVASASSDGKPSARVVLLKEFNKEGFVFFTNYNSRKGKEFRSNPFAALLFDWHVIERQVRIEGSIEKLPKIDSDNYFNSRPETAKIGAWASPQSRVIKDRDELEKLEEEIENQFDELPIYRPRHWGGYLIRPTCIEFWQGRPNRMHDRIVYYKTEDTWTMLRLAP